MIFILFSKLDCPPVARLAASKRSRSLSFLDLCAESAVPCKRGNFSKCRQFYVLPLAFHHIKRLGLPIRFCFFCAVKRFRFYEDSEAQLFFPWAAPSSSLHS